MVSTATIPSVSSISVQSSSGISTEKSSNTLDFGDVMSQSLKQQNQTNVQTSYSSDKNSSTTDNSVNDSVSDQDSSLDESSNSISDTSKNENDTGSSQISDEIDEAAKDIRDEIKEVLGVSDEDIEKAMSELGLNMQDLLQVGNISKLAAQLTGQSDVTAILTDSSLFTKVKSIMTMAEQTMNQLSQDTGVSVEDLQTMITDLDSKTLTSAQQATQTDSTDVIAGLGSQQTADEAITSDQSITSDKTVTVNQAEETSQDSDAQSSLAQKITVTGDTKSQNQNLNSDTESNQNQSSQTTSNESSVQSISQNMTQSIQNVFEESMVEMQDSVNATNIVNQIIDSVKVTGTAQLQSMEIQLNPENLGKVTLTVTSQNGSINAQIIAESEQVKRAIESQASVLRENLEKQGIKVESVEVTVQSQGYEEQQNLQGNQQNQQQQPSKTGRRSLKLDFEDSEEETADDSQLSQTSTLSTGLSRVDYMA